jgi:hypothetical protein
MELKQIDKLYLKVLFLVEAGIVVTQIFSWDTLTSAFFLLTFPLTVLIWLGACRRTFSGTDLMVVVASALATIGVFLNAAITSAQVDFASLKKLIMFVMALLFFVAAYRIRIDENMSAFIRKIVDALVLILIAVYFLRREQMYMLYGRYTSYLTFNFSNPNMTALFVSCLYMLKMNRLFEDGKLYVKLFHFLQQVILAWFLLETQSRNGMLVLAVFTVFTIWLVFKSKRNLRITKFWAVMFAVFPAVMVVGYMMLIQDEWVIRLLSFLVGEGKKLDSRVEVWGNALQYLGKSPLFGAYYEIYDSTGAHHMHNSHLDIAASYGLPVLVMVCVLLVRCLHQQGRIYKNKRDYIFILSFACSVLLGVGEAAMFSGGLGLYIMAGASLLLANKQDETLPDAV